MSEQISQHLHVSSPSQTAVKYTVSSRTRQPPIAVTVLKHILRVVIAFYAVLATTTKLQITSSNANEIHPYIQLCLQWTLMDQFFYSTIDKVEWWTVLATTALTLYLCMRRDYVGQCILTYLQLTSMTDMRKEESILVLQGLGIQTSTSSSYFILSPTTTFIPTTQIQDIVIHEAFKGFEVKFFLAIIVTGATEVVVVFPVCGFAGKHS